MLSVVKYESETQAETRVAPLASLANWNANSPQEPKSDSAFFPWPTPQFSINN